MEVEFEREMKFLLKSLPDLSNCERQEMVDIYIPRKEGHAAIRIRKKGERFVITKTTEAFEEGIKVLKEETIGITEEEFEVFRTMKDAKILEKTRYVYPLGDRKMEIDVFHGRHDGLVLAEVEFKSLEELKAFEKPDFCLAEVTKEDYLAGGVLYKLDWKDIVDKLDKLGYERLVLD
jgi:CYTH domain-containing protein